MDFTLEKIFVQMPNLNAEERRVLEQIAEIGQASRVFQGCEEGPLFRACLDQFVQMDRFYRTIGGIVGYHNKVLELMRQKQETHLCDWRFHAPIFHDISQETPEVKEAISWGIEALIHMAEIYPLAGAADRLQLVDSPAAKLPFAGKTLLEHLLCDLEAKEALYYEKFGVKLITPIAIMTSLEKNNHQQIVQMFEDVQFFGRPKESIRFFTQPLVPVVDNEGNWCMAAPLKPVMKPGGHGAIWQAAKEAGIFRWLETLGKSHCLVRQINNPLGGLDYGLLAFTGIGWKKGMVFGFASAPRLLKTAEGVNVLIEKGSKIVLSNIEYCDFDRFGIEDAPPFPGDPYSRFSSNTNLLFADLKAVTDAIEKCPFPGLLINRKKGSYRDVSGQIREMEMARLESTMQNIADVFEEEKGEHLKTAKTFVTKNVRHKTISTTKKAYVPGGAVQETPEQCFYDLLFAHRELLTSCGVHLPERREIQAYLEKGPEFLFLYHPSLGPLYSRIRQKIQGGSLALGAEWIVEIAELHAKNIKIQGSLQILAKRDARCVLENVTVNNAGVIWEASAPFWKMNLTRKESCKIFFKGTGHFIARNICFKGDQTWVIEDGQTLEVK